MAEDTRSDGPEGTPEQTQAPAPPPAEPTAQPAPKPLAPGFLARAAGGGALMGLANLVPGISGGTMLVAAGVYTPFIDAIGDLSRLRFSRPAILLLAVVVGAAVVAIGAGASIVSVGLAEFRWGMYSLFIGLTLGGAPLMASMVRPFGAGAVAGLILGVAAMVGLVFIQTTGVAGAGGEPGVVMLAVGGIAGASAMILPGVSGGYLLLLLGLYETIIEAIKSAVTALKDADAGALIDTMRVVIPVGIGVVVGVAVVGNILKLLLHRLEKPTLGFLLGLLLAAPAGLWPFRAGVEPEPGMILASGDLVTAENVEELREKPGKWDEAFFEPGPVQIAGSAGLIALGFGLTYGLGRLGAGRKR